MKKPRKPKVSELDLARAQRDYDVKLIEPEALSGLVRTILYRAGEAGQLDSVLPCLGRLVQRARLLEELARDAHGYVTGNPLAEARFTRMATGLARGGSLECGDGGAQPLAAMLTGLPMPGLPRPRLPCLFIQFGFDRLREGLFRLGTSIAETSNRPLEQVLGGLELGLGPLFDAMGRLELLHAEARREFVSGSLKSAGGGFGHFAVHLTGGDRPFPGPGEPEPFPLPGGFAFDPCGLERAGSSERAVRCFCRQSYVVESIVNLDAERADGAELVGEGCPGQRVAIRGRGFRATRDWPVPGESEVIFAGGRDGIAVPTTDYLSWSDTEVEVIVPAAAESGPISMRILCRDDNIGECGVQLRPPGGLAGARLFVLPPAPEITRFEVPARLPWCAPATISIRVTDADEVTLTDDTGRPVPFPEGEAGERRTIEGSVVVTEQETRTYTLAARNACTELTRTETVARERTFSVRTEGNPAAGESATVVLEHHCSPESLGWTEAVFTLTYDDPDGVLRDAPPERIVVAGGATEGRVSVPTVADTCGEVRFTATPADPSRYETSESVNWFQIDTPPRLTAVRAGGRNACDPFQFELDCDCVLPDRTVSVLLLRVDTGRLRSATVREVRPGEPRRTRGMTIVCQAPEELGAHRYRVAIEQLGVRSNEMDLGSTALRVPRPVIVSFDSSRSSIAGAPRDNELTWTVRYADRVDLWADGGVLDDRSRPGVIDSNAYTGSRCAVRTGRHGDRIQFSVVYELRAYGPGSSRPVTARREIIDSRTRREPAPIRGVRQIRFLNCDPSEHRLNVWTRKISPTPTAWEDHGGLAHGYDSAGFCPRFDAPTLDVSLDDGAVYEIQLVDPAAPTCDGRNDPRLTNCARLLPPGYVVGDEDGATLVFPFGGVPFTV